MKRPNVLLLVMDSTRAANVSCYGYEHRTTPNLDALAAQGARFAQALSPGCWTLPVHATLFTGRYPSSHGLTLSQHGLPAGFPTLAARLRDAGYRTGCFSNNAYISEATGLAQGFETVDDIWRMTNPRGIARAKGASRIKELQAKGAAYRPAVEALKLAARARSTWRAYQRGKITEDSGARLTHERLGAWLREGRRDDRPFFAFVNYMETHERYTPPRPWGRAFMPARFSPLRVAALPGKGDLLKAAPGTRRDDDLAILRGLYDGTIGYLDAQIGELVRTLEALGALDDTVVVVTADHGDSLGEHGHLGHRLYLYEQLVHVPLVVRHPATFAAGTVVDHQVSLGDLYAAILGWAGQSAPESQFPSLLASPAERPGWVVGENTAPKSLDRIDMQYVRTPEWKLIHRGDGAHELFHLASDPEESRNRYADEAAQVAQLERVLSDWRAALAGQEVESGDADYDDELLERLRVLGYAD